MFGSKIAPWRALAGAVAAGLLTVAVMACGGGGGSSSSGSGSSSSSSSSRSSSASSSSTANFIAGADVSWVSEEEDSGYSFYNAAAVKTDPFTLLADLGVHAIRLRVWVNPATKYNGADDVVAKAQRAAAAGQKILIDFHYSDSWADPGQQVKPAAWASHSLTGLESDVYQHTFDVLTKLKNAGITVSWVQVGNEINPGLLLPDGASTNFTNLAALTNQGYAAVKAVYPAAPVIIHIANGSDDAACRWFFDGFTGAGGKLDIIGLSHYPGTSRWASDNAAIAATMSDMIARYGKPVMVVETGFAWDQATTAKAMIADLVTRTKALGDNGLGVFYWEPEAYPNWKGYTKGALNSQGQFTAAMDPL